MARTKILIIGFGVMGKAIAQRLLASDRNAEVFANDQILSQLKTKKHPRLHLDPNLSSLLKADFIVLGFKPHDAKEALRSMRNKFNQKAVLVSILAGVPIKKIQSLSGHQKVVRMMPNLGLSVGVGIAGWRSSGLSVKEKQGAKKFLSNITENFEVKNEDMINKITAISGSGPAYFLLLARHLEKSARALGFSKDEARSLVSKTLSASAILSESKDYEELIKMIASKRGTTEAALKTFAGKNFEKIVSEAVKSAYKRARELSK